MLQSYSVPSAFFRILIGLAGWGALVGQLCLMLTPFHVGQTILNFFSYYTILTNLFAAFTLSVGLLYPKSRVGAFCNRVSVQTAIAGNILVVAIIYNLILARLWNPQGAQWVVDFSLHTAIPVLYILYWVFFVRKGTLTFRSPLPWLLYPLIYLLYSLVRGANTGWYPYPFVDASKLGYGKVGLNSLTMLVVFLLIYYAFILVDRWFGRKTIKHG